jgi:hypothetical protein
MAANRSLSKEIPWQLRLLFASARPGEVSREEIAALATEVKDWPALFASANGHCVRPLLHRALHASGFSGIPAEWQHSLEQGVRQVLKQNLAFTAELLRIVEFLGGRGIEAVPYKGPMLAVQAYGDIGLREFMDLDILVRHREIPKITEVMQENGYPLFTGSGGSKTKKSAEAIPGQYHFAKPPEFLPIEFHTEKTLRYYPSPIDADRFLEHLTPVEFGGRVLRGFDPELTLSILSVHGAKHLWNRLQWIADLAWLVNATPNFTWDVALDCAQELGAEKMVLTGVALASGLLGMALPDGVAGKIRRDKDVATLMEQSAREIFHPARAAANVTERAAYRVRSSPNRGAGIRQLVRLATSPTEEDRTEGGGSKLGNVLARPFRLARKYGIGAQRNPEPDLAPFAQTPEAVIDAMLALAAPRKGDVLYDLGCGDGAIVIRAAEKYGVRAVGLDLDAVLLSAARKNAKKRGVTDRVEFIQQDVKSTNLSRATIVTLLLSISGNLLLMPHLQTQLKHGARIVSARFDFPGWKPDEAKRIVIPGEKPWNVYLWHAASFTSPHDAARATSR